MLFSIIIIGVEPTTLLTAVSIIPSLPLKQWKKYSYGVRPDKNEDLINPLLSGSISYLK
jgi:type IV secretory pathway component VirB8